MKINAKEKTTFFNMHLCKSAGFNSETIIWGKWGKLLDGIEHGTFQDAREGPSSPQSKPYNTVGLKLFPWQARWAVPGSTTGQMVVLIQHPGLVWGGQQPGPAGGTGPSTSK